jgi:hypothetical protein
VSSIKEVTTVFRGDFERAAHESMKFLDNAGFARIQGLFSSSEILQCRGLLEASFSHLRDQKHDPRDAHLLMSNFQKLVVGGTSGPNGTPRFLRMFYLPFMDNDEFEIHEIFRRLAMFRNCLYGIDKQFATHGVESGVWSANRVHQYPRGGGFMATHTDVGTAKVAELIGLKDYVQVILIMSKKGVDFFTGGAYIVNKNGDREFYEDDCEIGDVVVYDGRIPHGVQDIDHLSPLDMASFTGRFVAMTTIFKVFSDKSGAEYSDLMK